MFLTNIIFPIAIASGFPNQVFHKKYHNARIFSDSGVVV